VRKVTSGKERTPLWRVQIFLRRKCLDVSS